MSDWIVIGLMLWTDIMLTFVLIHRIVKDHRREKAIMARAMKNAHPFEEINKTFMEIE